MFVFGQITCCRDRVGTSSSVMILSVSLSAYIHLFDSRNEGCFEQPVQCTQVCAYVLEQFTSMEIEWSIYVYSLLWIETMSVNSLLRTYQCS